MAGKDFSEWFTRLQADKARGQQGPPMPPQMSAYEPSWREQLAALIGGTDPEFGRRVTNALDFFPPTGAAMALDDSARAIGRGDVGEAALNAAGVIPLPAAKAGKFVKKGARKAAENAVEEFLPIERKERQARAKDEARQLAEEGRSPDEIITETGEAPPGASEEVVETAAEAKKRRSITADSLRHKPYEEAVATAKEGRHIIPKKEGGFVGAPYAAQSMADLEMIREKFDADVARGAAGSDWYQRTQDWIKQVAGNDPRRQSDLARNLALFSAQADPKTNLGFSIQAQTAAKMGRPAEKVRTGQQAETFNKAFGEQQEYDAADKAGKDRPEIALGKKTGIFGEHMDPTRENPTTGTNDIWHARALGYETPEGKPWDRALTPQQHSFMDAETVLAVDRANQAGLGGRSDWSPGEIQAAPWVANKAQGLAERWGWDPDRAFAEASKTYPDYAPNFQAFGTHEMVPGKETGHLGGIARGDQEARDQYSQAAPDWRGDDGRDLLYDRSLGLAAPTQENVGIFGDEFNRGNVAKPFVSYTGPSGAREIDPNSADMMTGVEAFRGAMDAQDAAAWSGLVRGNKTGLNNAFDVNLPAEMQGREGLARLQALAQGSPTPNVVHQGGNQAMLTNFAQDPPGGLGRRQAGDMNARLAEIGATATPATRGGDYIDYSHMWRGPAGGQGSDQVTQEMLNKLGWQGDDPSALMRSLDAPEVRARVLAKMDRDELVATQTGDTTRGDLQKLREVFAKDGFSGVIDGLGKGLFPVAAAASILPLLRDEAPGTNGGDNAL